jgi:hypothetical protein
MRSEAASPRVELLARVAVRSLLPLAKVLVEDDPRFRRRFARVTATVQLRALGPAEPLGICLAFDRGTVTVRPELLDAPTLELVFPSPRHLRGFLRGKPVLPRIRGMWRLLLLWRFFTLLLRLQLLHPRVRPDSEPDKRLKVKLMMYLVTTALSQANKSGDPRLLEWTRRQPERVYQLSVAPDGPGAYLRVKGGRTQAGRGLFSRRRPFVHLEFSSVEAALTVLLKEVEMIPAIRQGLLRVDGAPEYGAKLGDLMTGLQQELS